MTQPFIDTFLSQIRDKGFVKQNRFVAFIRPNQYVASRYLGYGGQSLAISQRLAVTCFSATIPTPSVMTTEFGITIPSRLVPYALNTNNQSGASFEFYCLGDMFEKELFPRWIEGIINPKTREPDYYDNYTKGSEIDLVIVPNIVKTFDEIVDFVSTASRRRARELSGFTFTEVYPYIYSYNNGSMNYSASTSPTTVKVDFMYREIIPFNRPDDSGPSDPRTNLPVVEIGDTQTSLFQREIQEFSLDDAYREYGQAQKRNLSAQYEKKRVAELYNQTSNVPRGVDGKLLNPKVDGLPAENPNDRIRSALFGALSFVDQARGFGII